MVIMPPEEAQVLVLANARELATMRRRGREAYRTARSTLLRTAPLNDPYEVLAAADDDEARVACSFQNAVLAGGHQDGLGDDSEDLLNASRVPPRAKLRPRSRASRTRPRRRRARDDDLARQSWSERLGECDGPWRIRTSDLGIKSPLLYQLS